MDKTLQDLVWSILPKKFKEEVKKLYVEIEVELSKEKGVTDNRTWQYRGMKSQLVCLFGIHNLTSDAEVEEMLIVSRKRVQEIYTQNQNGIIRENVSSSDKDCYEYANEVLKTLFGSKCLPDELDEDNFVKLGPKYRKGEKVCYNGYVYEIEGLVGKNRYALKGLNFDLDEDMIDPYEPYTEPSSQNSPENCNNAVHISTECDKTVEPKFKAGNRVIYKNTGKVKIVVNIAEDGRYVVASPDGKSPYLAKESDLEPYTESKNKDSGFIRAESVKEVRIASEESHLRNFSQETANCDKHFDNIFKDSFSKERRLNIAAMVMQGILSNAERMKQYGEIAMRESDNLTQRTTVRDSRYSLKR